MAVEIISIQKQVLFKVITDIGEYQDALYLPPDDVIDLPTIEAKAQTRADAWVKNIVNVPPVLELPLEDLLSQQADLQAKLIEVQTKIDIIPSIDTDTTPPTTPENLAGGWGKVGLELKWDKSFDEVGLAGYFIYRDDELIDSSAREQFIDVKADKKTEYTYAVSAFDKAGNESEHTKSITVSPPKGIESLA